MKKILLLLKPLVQKPLTLILPLILFFLGWWFALPPAHKSDTEPSATTQEWTCSMHPQIRQPNSGLCPICNMELIPLEAGNDDGGLREISISPEAAALMDLRVSPVIRKTANMDIMLFGKIDYDERKTVTTTARISGRLDRLFADFTGTTVSKGDAIAQIYSPELYVAQQELIQALKASKQSGNPTTKKMHLSMLKAAREKLRLLELNDNQIQAIEKQKKPSDHITLTAPQDGIVIKLHVKEGSYVKTGQPLFAIARLDTVWLKMEAYETDLPWLRYAQEVTFNVQAIPGKTFHGRIAFIAPQLDAMKRIIRIRVNVDNKQGLLKPGMFAQASARSQVALHGRVLEADLAGKWISPMHPEIIKDQPGKCDLCGMPLIPAEKFGYVASAVTSEKPLLVPTSALLLTGKRAVVYVRIASTAGPVFEGREIILGSKAGDHYIVKQGLSEGELVVTNGAYKLDSELQIKARPSMMNPNAGLEERPAKNAPKQLVGQWSPFLRSYGRLTTAIQNADTTGTYTALKRMQFILNNIRYNHLTSRELALWKEFSIRLNNSLTLAQDMKPDHAMLSQLRHQMLEISRYTGLTSRPIFTIQLTNEKLPALKELTASYFIISKALSDDKVDDANKAVSDFYNLIEKLPKKDIYADLRNTTKHLTKQTEIKQIRYTFKPVSDALIHLIREHGIDQLGNIYLLHCPMANDGKGNKGADWLSDEPAIRNPYFGESMYDCGMIKDTLSLNLPEIKQ